MPVIVTCHTTDWLDPATGQIGPCPSIDKPVPMTLTYPDSLTGEIHTVSIVICGSCNQQITDIV
jgi:hypothetical protein